MFGVKERSPRRTQQVCTGRQIKKLAMGKLKLAVEAERDSRQIPRQLEQRITAVGFYIWQINVCQGEMVTIKNYQSIGGPKK